ncbi:hypothetical protein [Legionella sp. PC997]|uniref:hypothetical protein n=1 Tax=Legionella sp. PC997 TaxID=2755562 RepID=UPI0015FB9380|nr:hypothetical protein [Legionella sp. PC997]QMT59319.1 hypothetical protein HBNCFIEN_00684 [Legionella sp. PC997]
MFKKKAVNVSETAESTTKEATSVNFKNFLEGAKKDAKKYDLIDTGVTIPSYPFLSPQNKYKRLKPQIPPFIVQGLQIMDEEPFEPKPTSP